MLQFNLTIMVEFSEEFSQITREIAKIKEIPDQCFKKWAKIRKIKEIPDNEQIRNNILKNRLQY